MKNRKRRKRRAKRRRSDNERSNLKATKPQVPVSPPPDLSDANVMLRPARRAGFIGTPVYLLFAIPDWFDYHDIRLLLIRGVTGCCFVALLAASYWPSGKRHPYALVFIAFFLASVSLAVIMILANDIDGNAEGFGLITLLFCLLVPATMTQLVVACVCFSALYILPALIAPALSTSIFPPKLNSRN